MRYFNFIKRLFVFCLCTAFSASAVFAEEQLPHADTYLPLARDVHKIIKLYDDPTDLMATYPPKEILPPEVWKYMKTDVEKSKRMTAELVGFKSPDQVNKIAPAGKKRGNIVTYQVGLEILDPDDQVKPDMSCDVDLVIEKAENVIYLPVDTIEKKEGRNYVWINREGKLGLQEVILGVANEKHVEIKEGIKEGEQVRLLRPGMAQEEPGEEPRKALGRDFR